MKISLVTTTIHIPHVLRLYSAYGPDIHFIVIGDRRTPHQQVGDLCDHLGNAVYYSPEAQQELNYACSELIPWNCVQRRNIGFLEALKWGADVIISIDDDNIPMAEDYFSRFTRLFAPGTYAPTGWNGLQLSNHDIEPEAWFDPGRLLVPPVRHRGLPINVRSPDFQVSHIVGAKIGVAAGLWCGDPDISAVDRISSRPEVIQPSEIARSGFVVELTTPTVFNSQNTAIVRDLVPAWMMLPHVGRYDDIFASLICHRIMREHDYYLHFGPPFVYQQRNNHNLLNDLQAEIFGMEYVQHFQDWLEDISLDKFPTLIDQVESIYRLMWQLQVHGMPEQVRETGLAWIEDCRKVMK